MAPEQARGDGEVDARADLYALGATLFEMIAGRPPHVGPTPIAILARLVTTPRRASRRSSSDAPPRLDEIMARLLATAPTDRPASASEVARELREIAAELSADAAEGRTRSFPSQEVPTASQTTDKSGGTRLVTTIVATRVPEGRPARAPPHPSSRPRSRRDRARRRRDRVPPRRAQDRSATRRSRALDLGLRVAKINATVGIATGRTRIDRTRPTGEVVDRAAALARDALRGQVLADTTTTELTRGRYELQLRGDGSAIVGAALRGKKESGGGVPFVGREAELAQIVAAFERCVEDRTPIVVTVTGAPGMGKTRLRREALSRIASHASAPRVALRAQRVVLEEPRARGRRRTLRAGSRAWPRARPLQEALRRDRRAHRRQRGLVLARATRAHRATRRQRAASGGRRHARRARRAVARA